MCSEQTLGLENKKKPRVRFDGDVEDQEFDSDDEFPDYLLDENDPEAMRKMGFAGYSKVQDEWEGDVKYLPGGDKAAAVSALSAEAREALELQFEKTMLEYEDDEIGYLDDVSLSCGSDCVVSLCINQFPCTEQKCHYFCMNNTPFYNALLISFFLLDIECVVIVGRGGHRRHNRSRRGPSSPGLRTGRVPAGTH